MEIVEISFWLCLVLVVFTLVGHGLWVVFRAILRGVASLFVESGPKPLLGEVCPRCGEALRSVGTPRCFLCGWPAVSTSEPHVLRYLLRRIEQFHRFGLISASARDELLRVIETLAPAPAPAASEPAPASQPSAAQPQADITFLPIQEPVRAPAANAAIESVELIIDEPAPKLAEPSPTPQPSLRLLSTFLEEKNIRWGELVAGLLIVGCSLALVISFWATIARQPLLRFGLFNGVTALVFTLGFHAERRWRLPMTARGLLTIAALLTPLTFLAVASLGRGVVVETTWGVIGEIVAVVLFALLAWRAGQSLVSRSAVAFVLGVLVPSVSLLLIRRWIGPATARPAFLALAAIPLLGQAVGTGLLLLVARRQKAADGSFSAEVLRLVGVSAFATGLALGLLVERGGSVLVSLHKVTPLVPLVGASLLAPGLVLWRRIHSAELIAQRVAGASIAAAGALVMLAAVALAWPVPGEMIAVALLDFVVLTALASECSFPAAHVVAGLCLALAYALGGLMVTGRLGWQSASALHTAGALTSGTAGAILVPLVVVFGALAAWMLRAGRRLDAQAFAMVGALAGVFSIAIVAWQSLGRAGDPTAVAVFGVYAIATLLAGGWFGRHPLVSESTAETETEVLAWASSALLLAALVQALVYGAVPLSLSFPWSAVLLAEATLTIGLAGALDALAKRADAAGVRISAILTLSALAAAVGTTALLLLATSEAAAITIATRAFWLALVWLALAWRSASAGQFAAFQAALTGAVIFGVGAVLERRTWFIQSERRWLDPWTIQAEAIALAVLSMVWIGARVAARRMVGQRSATIVRWLSPPWPAFDRWVRWAVVLCAIGLPLYGVVPGAAQELVPKSLARRLAGNTSDWTVKTRVVPPASVFELDRVPHAHALGAGSGLLLALVAAMLLLGQWEQFRRIDVLLLLVVLAMTAPLWAGRWERDVAVGSALRWSSAMVLLLSSALIWTRDRLARWALRAGWECGDQNAAALGRQATEVVIFLAVAPLLAMGAFVAATALVETSISPSQVSRWQGAGLAFVLLFGCGFVLLARSRSPAVVDERFSDPPERQWTRPLGALLMVLGVLPFVAVSVFLVATALRGNPIVGPQPGSFFMRITNAGSYVPPILLMAATFVGYAACERSSRFAFTAGLVLNLAATVGFLLASARAGTVLDAALAARLAHVNAAVAAICVMLWVGSLTYARRRVSSPGPVLPDALLTTLVALAPALNLIVLVSGVVSLWLDPIPGPFLGAIAAPLSWLALGLAGAAAWLWARFARPEIAPEWLGLGVLCLASLLAFGLVPRDTGDWRTYHGMIVALGLAPVALLLGAWHRAGLRLEQINVRLRSSIVRWSTVAILIVVAFAIRAYASDPGSPWWTVGALSGMGMLAVVLACWSLRPGFLYVASVLFNSAMTGWWISMPWWSVPRDVWAVLANLLNMNIITLALPAPVWLWIEQRYLRVADEPEVVRDSWPGRVLPHQVIAWVALGTLCCVVSVGFVHDVSQTVTHPSAWLGWTAVLAVIIATGTGLWSVRGAGSMVGLYLAGLAMVGWGVHQLHLPMRWLAWLGTVALAAYSVATSYAWNRRSILRAWADRLKIPRPDSADPLAALGWLVPVNLVLAVGVLALAFGTVLSDRDAILRTTAAHAALAEVLSIGLLAHGERRLQLQFATLGVGVLGAVAWGWAWVSPADPNVVMDRLVVIVVALTAAVALYGIGLTKLIRRENEWTQAAQRLVPALLACTAGALAVVMAVEIFKRAEGREIAISTGAVGAVAAAILGAAIAALVAALVPGRDPFGLSERGRTAYVYGCEVLLAVLALHLKLTLPWLFTGFFVKYWPLIVLGLAFLGVGLSELFRRQGRSVLAEPLQRTGALLPVLPLIASFWTQPKPGDDVLFLVLAGALYTTLSLLRQSLGAGALAALAYNGALWTMLGRQDGLGLAHHPQLWIIPPAICVLVGAHLNRDRLTDTQSASIRYAASLAIYLSSTADIVLIGVARAPWLPLVLAALAIAGVLVGILLRIRGFVLLGVGFLSLSLFTIIWYAAVDLRHTWLWSASGIAAGIVILALFALFEKKREEVLRAVDTFRGWNP